MHQSRAQLDSSHTHTHTTLSSASLTHTHTAYLQYICSVCGGGGSGEHARVQSTAAAHIARKTGLRAHSLIFSRV